MMEGQKARLQHRELRALYSFANGVWVFLRPTVLFTDLRLIVLIREELKL